MVAHAATRNFREHRGTPPLCVLHVYASNAAGLTALKSEEMSVCLAEYPADLVAAAYVHVKAQRFAGLTLTTV